MITLSIILIITILLLAGLSVIVDEKNRKIEECECDSETRRLTITSLRNEISLLRLECLRMSISKNTTIDNLKRDGVFIHKETGEIICLEDYEEVGKL